MCAIYMPPDKNVQHRKYNIDVFDVLQEHIEHFSALGTVSVIGDINGRVGIESDFILDDILDENLQDNINFIDYVKDDIFTDRLSEDLKVPNSFGRRILELCKSTGLRICNGRFGVDSSKFTFQNKNGCSVIGYLLISSDCVYSLIKKLTVKEFNTYSCHAPLAVELYMKGNRVIKDQCTCMKTVYDTNRWNEGFKDDILNDMMMNAQKFDDFLINITEHENSVDECVEQLSILLADIF